MTRQPRTPVDRSRLGALIGTGDPVVGVTEAFDRVEAVDDPAIFIATTDATAAIAALNPELPLAGLTFAAKNNIDVEGVPTTAGCPSYAFIPTESAPAVQRLLDAGATCVGVTNLDQFATGLVGTRSPYGIPLNAVDPALVPGGSSAGSAVAVARGLVDIALGTDTAGSGRVPAAQNRIVGIKPTRGRLPTRGVVPAVASLDCVSIFARSVSLAALGLDVCTGYDELDPWSREATHPPMVMPTLTVGVPRNPELATVLDMAAWTDSVDELMALPFVEVVAVDIDALVETGRMLYEGPWVAERYAAVGRFLDTEPDDADPTVAGIICGASERTAVEAYEANYRLQALRLQADAVWTHVDVLMVPTTPGVATLDEVAADPVGRNSALGHYTNWVNLLDQCAVAVPGVDRSDGWPFGVTFLGQAWADETLIDLAKRYVHELPIADHEPFAGPGGVDVVVVGAHLRGQPLNWQLTDHGGQFVSAGSTTDDYRLYALGGPGIKKPALVRSPGEGAQSIEVETWRLPTSELGAFASYIPAPLGLGRVQLADGSTPTGFIAEAIATDGATDVTEFGGWRAYLRSTGVDVADV